MSTIYDFATVGAFLVMVGAYLKLAQGDVKLLQWLMLPAVAFAVANQLGNRGYGLFATLLLAAGAGLAYLLFRRRDVDGSGNSA